MSAWFDPDYFTQSSVYRIPGLFAICFFLFKDEEVAFSGKFMFPLTVLESAAEAQALPARDKVCSRSSGFACPG